MTRSEMDPFSINGRFCFPDEVFPSVTESMAAAVPKLPTVAAAELEAQFQDLIAEGDAYPVHRLFKWVQNILHTANLYGLGSPRAIEHAKHVLETTSASNSPYAGLASYFLGTYYQAGILGFPADKDKSRNLLRRAIKLQYPRAWYRIATNAETRGDHAKALSRYKQGAALDDAACLYRLAIAHFLGQFDVPRDVTRAFSILEAAARRADADYPHPAFLLGKLYLGEAELVPGLGKVPQRQIDKRRGFDLLTKAAFLDFSPALMRMADAYQGEFAFDSTVTMRFLHLCSRQERYLAYMRRPSVLHGAPETLLVKWFLCGFENIFGPNEKWAFNFANVAAQSGAGTALFAMGYFYEVGINVPADWTMAERYYKQSAAAGCDAAKERLRRSDQPTREPSLRRQLTRVDHERTLSKYRARLAQGHQRGPSMMVMDSLDHTPDSTPEPPALPPIEPKIIPQTATQVSHVLQESPVLAAPVPRSPPKLPYPDEDNGSRRRSFFGAAKEMLSSLPYPKSRSPSPKRPQRSPQAPPVKTPAYPISNPPSPERSLPYPDNAPKSSPKKTPYPDSPPPSAPSRVTSGVPEAPRAASGQISALPASQTPVSVSAPVIQPEISVKAAVPPLVPQLQTTSLQPPYPSSGSSGQRIPSRQQVVRRKPVARAVSGPVASSASSVPPPAHHARSQTVSVDAQDLRDWTPSPTHSTASGTPSPTAGPTGRRPPSMTRSTPSPVRSTPSPVRNKPPIPGFSGPAMASAPVLPAPNTLASTSSTPSGARHRKSESMAIPAPASSPPRPQRRMASSPVSNRGPSPVRRPGVAYSFEEMGVPVIAGDDSGKCIIS